jgi:DNA-binding MarR family transcriptional regulator
MYGYFVLYLDARNNGITLSAIQDFCREVGLASPGRAAAILVHMRAIGYIKPDPAPGDRRSRRYLPSPEMKAALREAIIGEAKALAQVEPEANRIAARLEEPEFFKAYVQRLGTSLTNLLRTNRPGSIALFADRNAGLIILFDILMSAAEGDEYPPRGRLAMSVTALSKKFEVSRSHVFRLLRDAEKAGYLKRDADEQNGTISESLRADIVEFHAYVFMGLAMCGHFALTSNTANAGTQAAE